LNLDSKNELVILREVYATKPNLPVEQLGGRSTPQVTPQVVRLLKG